MMEDMDTQAKNKQDVVFLRGERVYLRPVERDDLAHIMRWLNDPELRALTGDVRPMDQLGAEEYLQRLHDDKSRIWFVIVRKQDGRLIGETGLLRMFPPWRTTDMSLIIGEADTRGKGYGREVMEIMLDFAFGAMNFNRVAIGVVGFNEQALKFYKQVGFVQEGVQRQGYYHGYRYYDFIMMSLLKQEYAARRGK